MYLPFPHNRLQNLRQKCMIRRSNTPVIQGIRSRGRVLEAIPSLMQDVGSKPPLRVCRQLAVVE
jgi:hypothetical protein